MVVLKMRYAIISAAAIVFGLNHFRNLVQFSGNENRNGIKVMTWNVRLFDLYNWSDNLNTRADMFSLIREQSPDILCMQEFFSRDQSEFSNLDTLLRSQHAQYHHVEYSITLHGRDHWGMCTLSKFPVIGKGKVLFSKNSNNFCIWTDLKTDDDTVRVFNVHLQSNHLQQKDYELLENPDEKNNEQIIASSKSILKRLKISIPKRAQQADTVSALIRSSPHPVIVCGDFNDPPFTYAYRKMKNDLCDAFTESGIGFGITYTGAFPPYRIDYILHDKIFNSSSYKTINEKLTDHFPVVCHLSKVNSE